MEVSRGRRSAGFSPVPWLIWLIAAVVLLPVLVVVWHAAQPSELWTQIAQTRLPGHLRHTLLLVFSVTALAILFGIPAAWHVSVHDFPGRKMFEWLLLLPLAMPGFIAAIAYVDAFKGLVPFYILVREHFGVEAFLAIQQVAPWVFAVVVLASTLFPYVFLSCRAVFAREAAGSLEAARMLGSGNLRAFARVGLPMARPAVVAGGSLVAMETLNDYGVVAHFGLNPLTPGIFRAWTEGHLGSAMRLSLILMAIVLIGLALERWQRGRKRFATDTTESPLSRRRLSHFGAAGAWIACGVPLALGFVLPAAQLARWAAGSWSGMRWQETFSALANSLILAAGAAVLIAMAGALLVAGRHAYNRPSLFTAQQIGLLGYTFPSALVAVGVGALVSALAGQEWAPQLAGLALSVSVFGLMLAYFTRFLAVGIQPVSAAFDRLPANLHEAARTLGFRPLRALFRVDLPLVWPALIAGATLGFIDVFKELPLTLVLRPFDFETLATLAFRLTDEGRIPEASVPALSMVAFSCAGLIPMTMLLRRISSRSP